MNLPAADKRTPPRYQSLDTDRIPVVEGDGWRARIVAGTLLGATGPAATHTPIGYAHVTVQPGASVSMSVPADHNAGVYAFGGTATVGSPPEALPERHLALFGREPGALVVAVPDDAPGPCDALVLTGRPACGARGPATGRS